MFSTYSEAHCGQLTAKSSVFSCYIVWTRVSYVSTQLNYLSFLLEFLHQESYVKDQYFPLTVTVLLTVSGCTTR